MAQRARSPMPFGQPQLLHRGFQWIGSFRFPPGWGLGIPTAPFFPHRSSVLVWGRPGVPGRNDESDLSEVFDNLVFGATAGCGDRLHDVRHLLPSGRATMLAAELGTSDVETSLAGDIADRGDWSGLLWHEIAHGRRLPSQGHGPSALFRDLTLYKGSVDDHRAEGWDPLLSGAAWPGGDIARLHLCRSSHPTTHNLVIGSWGL